MRRLLPALAALTLLLTGCANESASDLDASIPTWRVGSEGELKRVIIQKQDGDPLECVVYVDHGYRGGLSCNWQGGDE